MDGGTLQIEYNEEDEHVYMTGPAAFVFEGEIQVEWEMLKMRNEKFSCIHEVNIKHLAFNIKIKRTQT